MTLTQSDASSLMSAVSAFKVEKGIKPRLRPPETTSEWPIDYSRVEEWRTLQRHKLDHDEKLAASARQYYATHPVEFINHWITTYDPRNATRSLPVYVPLILFPKQVELVWFVITCMKSEANGIIEKSRDMGATWVCCGVSIWLWLFHDGTSIGWGSAKADKVDVIGNPSSIFEKLRIAIRKLPRALMPPTFNERDHLYYLRAINPENGSSIIGEIGDNIGRGGRTTIYFKDESAHYEHPELIEASLLSNSRCQIDMSSVGPLGNVFHTKRESAIEWNMGDEMQAGRTYAFIMDWSDHPGKTRKWYDTEKQRLADSGLPHVFAREIERNYAASAEGVVIPAEWVKAAVGAHRKLGIEPSGGWYAGLDVADSHAGDRNAGSVRHGIVLIDLDIWGERDTGLTTRRIVVMADKHRQGSKIDIEYDAIGVGSGVKAESNRLEDAKLMPKGMRFISWYAGGAVINGGERVVPGDPQSPKNKDFFANLKAQAWWSLRRRFELTFRRLHEEGFSCPDDDLISIAEGLPHLQTLIKELSQVTSKYSQAMKLMIDKAPEGTKSPNAADSVVMNYFPIMDSSLTTNFGFATPQFVTPGRR